MNAFSQLVVARVAPLRVPTVWVRPVAALSLVGLSLIIARDAGSAPSRATAPRLQPVASAPPGVGLRGLAVLGRRILVSSGRRVLSLDRTLRVWRPIRLPGAATDDLRSASGDAEDSMEISVAQVPADPSVAAPRVRAIALTASGLLVGLPDGVLEVRRLGSARVARRVRLDGRSAHCMVVGGEGRTVLVAQGSRLWARRGRRWRRLAGAPVARWHLLAAHPVRGGLLLAGDGERLYRSSNGGRRFDRVRLPTLGQPLSRALFARCGGPRDGGSLLVAAGSVVARRSRHGRWRVVILPAPVRAAAGAGGATRSTWLVADRLYRWRCGAPRPEPASVPLGPLPVALARTRSRSRRLSLAGTRPRSRRLSLARTRSRSRGLALAGTRPRSRRLAPAGTRPRSRRLALARTRSRSRASGRAPRPRRRHASSLWLLAGGALYRILEQAPSSRSRRHRGRGFPGRRRGARRRAAWRRSAAARVRDLTARALVRARRRDETRARRLRRDLGAALRHAALRGAWRRRFVPKVSLRVLGGVRRGRSGSWPPTGVPSELCAARAETRLLVSLSWPLEQSDPILARMHAAALLRHVAARDLWRPRPLEGHTPPRPSSLPPRRFP